MAKRRKDKDEEEDTSFKLPKFDPEAFLKREKRNIKTTFISFLFGIVIAAISFGFWVLLSGQAIRWPLVLLLGIVTGSWLKYLFIKFKVDLTGFTKTNWFSSYMIYFFTWLVVLMVIVNPPFYDEEKPNVTLVILPEMQEPGGTVMILAKITDNTGIDKQDITFTVDDKSISSDDFDFIDNVFRYTYESNATLSGDETYNFKLTAKDSSGHKTEKTGSFTFSTSTLTVPEPPGVGTSPGPEVGYATTIKIDSKAEVNRVYYTIDGSSKEINATYNKDDGLYTTKPIKNGWPSNGSAVKIKPYAQVVYYFENINEKFSNTIVDTSVYYFNVTKDPSIGTEANVEIGLPTAHYVKSPGFETLALLVSLGAVVLIFKYRKKHRRNNT